MESRCLQPRCAWRQVPRPWRPGGGCSGRLVNPPIIMDNHASICRSFSNLLKIIVGHKCWWMVGWFLAPPRTLFSSKRPPNMNKISTKLGLVVVGYYSRLVGWIILYPLGRHIQKESEESREKLLFFHFLNNCMLIVLSHVFSFQFFFGPLCGALDWRGLVLGGCASTTIGWHGRRVCTPASGTGFLYIPQLLVGVCHSSTAETSYSKTHERNIRNGWFKTSKPITNIIFGEMISRL